MFKYINLSRILRQIVEEGAQLKNVLYHSTSLKKSDIPAAYSLLSLIVNNYKELEEAEENILQKSKLEIKNKYLLMIMMGQYINKGKIIGGGKVKRALFENLPLIPKINKQSKFNKSKVQIRLRESQEDFEKMSQLIAAKGQKDKLIPNLYSFQYQIYSQLTKNQNANILNSDVCVIQSYSSCLPAFLLLQGVKSKWVNKKYDVIDACSAPGNKTIQLAEYLGKNGHVFAFEKNNKRYQLLKSTLKKYKVFNVKPQNMDFLEVKPSNFNKNLKFILLDPSCSGSGMLTNFSRDSLDEPSDKDHVKVQQQFEEFCDRKYKLLSESEKERVCKLHDFQLNLLNHAASFKPIRLSYSTCSIYKKQNEEVVSQFLQKNQDYKIKKIKIVHQSIHKGFEKKCLNCIRMDPRRMQTDGFFVAIFCRNKTTE